MVTSISGDGASLQDMIVAYNRYGLAGFPSLPSSVFDRAHHGLHEGWVAAVDNFASSLDPFLRNGTVEV